MGCDACLELMTEVRSTVPARAFIQIVEDWFASAGTTPELIQIKGPEFSGKVVGFKRFKQGIDSKNFDNVSRVTVLNRKPGSESFQETDITASIDTFECSMRVSDTFYNIAQVGWQRMAGLLYSIRPFSYGYAFMMEEEYGPGWYGSGILYGGVRSGDPFGDEIRSDWGRALRDPRNHPRNVIIRQVYRLQFLSESHMSLSIEGTTLRKWIEGSPERGTLSPLAAGMFTWSLPDAQAVFKANQALLAAGLLVAWDPRARVIL